jgi:hypothetical protein
MDISEEIIDEETGGVPIENQPKEGTCTAVMDKSNDISHTEGDDMNGLDGILFYEQKYCTVCNIEQVSSNLIIISQFDVNIAKNAKSVLLLTIIIVLGLPIV